MARAKTVTIRGPVRKGMRILMEPRPGPKRWYNPDGEDFTTTRPLTPWISSLIRHGDVEVVEQEQPKKHAKARKGGDR